MKRKVALEVKNLNKYFGGIKALVNANLKLYEGEIIAIVGDNGAGKSTLIKIVSGVHKKTSGEIFINEKEVKINGPLDAKKYGVETVYQDEGIIPILDSTSNLFLGREKYKSNILGKLFKVLDFRYMREETSDLLNKIGTDIKDLDSEVRNLSGGQRQTIVIGRAAYWGGKIVILDEPTNNLGVKQEKAVLNLIQKLRDDYNISIILISHNISHVFEVVDRIIVLRNGEVIGERIKSKTNKNEIISMITGVKEA